MKQTNIFQGCTLQCDVNIFQLNKSITISLVNINNELTDIVIQQPIDDCEPINLLGSSNTLKNISKWLSEIIQKQVCIISSVLIEFDGKTEIELLKHLHETIKQMQ
ncbi:hypothetical protein SS50377_23355 [Spironucleus salmonicida]|uniref:Proteasome assembly chaperone 3 n=1 Tax=Spironucleus salmonicida TaxID=348837 RepID=V6LU59_9EUKA|nr:hypothetical protein SS50377_23355 [Spironucleus salmonicida]|eukprot:EST47226.1 Hypothetical protein SS50377_12737 [Spironucleus salmonicida]